MSQRMQFTFGLLMTTACLASGMLAWMSASESAASRQLADQVVAERLDRLVAAIGSSQKTADVGSTPSEWVNLQVRLVKDQLGVVPAEGFIVVLPQILVSPGVPLKKVSGPTGIVDLGLVRVARYSLGIIAPWNEFCNVEFDVRAGATSQTEIVTCPAAPPAQGEVSVKVDWPEDLRLAGVGLVCTVSSEPTQELNGCEWYDNDAISHTVFLAGDGTT